MVPDKREELGDSGRQRIAFTRLSSVFLCWFARLLWGFAWLILAKVVCFDWVSGEELGDF